MPFLTIVNNLPLILRVLGLIFLLITLSLGAYGHFVSKATKIWENEQVQKVYKCAETKLVNCPREALNMEMFLIVIAILFIIISFIVLCICIIRKGSQACRLADAIFHGVSGVMMICGASVQVHAAVSLDTLDIQRIKRLRSKTNSTEVQDLIGGYINNDTKEVDVEKLRKDYKSKVKLACAAFAYMNGIIYLIIALLILRKMRKVSKERAKERKSVAPKPKAKKSKSNRKSKVSLGSSRTNDKSQVSLSSKSLASRKALASASASASEAESERSEYFRKKSRRKSAKRKSKRRRRKESTSSSSSSSSS